jgi:hypothetical protein
MIEYQPKQPKLFNLGIDLLEKGLQGVQFNGIKAFINEDQTCLRADLELETGEIKSVYSSVRNKLKDEQENLAYLENQLADEIKIYFALGKWLEVVPPLAKA